MSSLASEVALDLSKPTHSRLHPPHPQTRRQQWRTTLKAAPRSPPSPKTNCLHPPPRPTQPQIQQSQTTNKNKSKTCSPPCLQQRSGARTHASPAPRDLTTLQPSRPPRPTTTSPPTPRAQCPRHLAPTPLASQQHKTSTRSPQTSSTSVSGRAVRSATSATKTS